MGRWESVRTIGWVMWVLAAVWGCQQEHTAKPRALSLTQAWRLDLAAATHLYPIRQGNQMLFSWYEDVQQCFATVDLQSGKIKTYWCCDLFSSRPLYYNLLSGFLRGKWVLPLAQGVVIPDEQTKSCVVWVAPFDFGEAALSVHKEKIYRVYYKNHHREAAITVLDVATDSLHILRTLTAPDGATIFLKNPFVYGGDAEGDVLVVGYTHYYAASRRTHNGVLRVALPEGQILSDLPLDANDKAWGLNHHPERAGHLSFWTIQALLICYDHKHNRICWRRQMPAPMVTSRLVVHDGTLYFAAEDGELYALDSSSGTLLWTAPIGGSPSRVFISGEWLFLVGGSDGILYGIRRSDGAIVLTKRAAQHSIAEGIYYQRTCYADEEGVLLFDGEVWTYYSLD